MRERRQTVDHRTDILGADIRVFQLPRLAVLQLSCAADFLAWVPAVCSFTPPPGCETTIARTIGLP
jgi:hypothetical protein